MKTLIVQCYHTREVAGWIGRCLASVEAWAGARGHDYRFFDGAAFELCGEAYLRRVGDNKVAMANLARLELIRQAHQQGYDRAIWVDADVQVFDPDNFDIAPAPRLRMARETWLQPAQGSWGFASTLNNCVVASNAGDPDLDFLIQATRHRALHREFTHNFEVGVQLIRALHPILDFDLIDNVGMFSAHMVQAIAQGDADAMRRQAACHKTPVQAANLSVSLHLSVRLPEAVILQAMDVLEHSRGEAINGHLRPSGPAQ